MNPNIAEIESSIGAYALRSTSDAILEPAAVGQWWEVTATWATLHEEPVEASPKVGRLLKGKQAVSLETRGDWVRVQSMAHASLSAWLLTRKAGVLWASTTGVFAAPVGGPGERRSGVGSLLRWAKPGRSRLTGKEEANVRAVVLAREKEAMADLINGIKVSVITRYERLVL
jgi:hypothetical protein